MAACVRGLFAMRQVAILLPLFYRNDIFGLPASPLPR
jgi:hypothetical protein